jgi:DNA-binding transcriptional LysR family regulator
VDLDLRLVRYFVAVGDELHFGRAAAKLYISQPALSKQIRRLEAQLGSPLLVRDSRHVALTERGERFLGDARQLLAVAARMQHHSEAGTVRIAHIFELATSRIVADAFARAHPDVALVERSQDSYGQLRSLLSNQLDVAIVRVTPRMLDEHPSGWCHRPLRREPLVLVGRPGEPARETASLYERPVEVFADPPGSGMYNAHGEYMSALERDIGVPLTWLGNPGTFLNCLAAVRRSVRPGLVLEFDSYARRYADAGLPVHVPAEVQPSYLWSLAWRDERPTQAVADFLATALDTARQHHWLSVA